MTENNLEKLALVWTKINVKAWQDKKFKERLLKNPKETLKEFGIETPKHFREIKIQDAPQGDVLHLQLLPPPPLRPISEEHLEKISGAGDCTCG